MSQQGAPAAYRGYRVQALYTLRRVLGTEAETQTIYQPEGVEDLDILTSDRILIEAIQVKSYPNLVLSNIKPDDKNSFFRRALNLIKQPSPVIIRLVNFGKIGNELVEAWRGSERQRSEITRKLGEVGYSEEEIQQIFNNIDLVEEDENQLYKELRNQLEITFTGINTDSALDLLNYWIYLLSERRELITRGELINKIHNIGKFLSDRLAYYQEWFTTISPIEDTSLQEDQLEILRKEFFEGVSTRYEHILAGIDFYREQKLSQITQAFQSSRIVIVHAASGQGKTTLAYRYLHDQYPQTWRYSIKLVQDRQHALRIATALAGHANALHSPMAVYIDVSPKDVEWPELVKQLATNSYFNVLVTIREEDFFRANVAGLFDFASVELDFDETEARNIYERAVTTGHNRVYLDFESAWAAFGGQGPLLEFVYLLTQTITLRQRLEAQVKRISTEVRENKISPDEIKLLRLVAVANAYEARVGTSKLLELLTLPIPELTLKYFENEYFLRVSKDGHYIDGLHPSRSTILVELLTSPDINPWIEVAIELLPLIVEDDLESFILHALIDRTNEYQRLLNAVRVFQPLTIAGIAGILRCLLWASVRDYVEENIHAVKKAYEEMGPGWYFIVDFNFATEDAPNLDSWWENFPNLFSNERLAIFKEIKASQTPKGTVFEDVADWLRKFNSIPQFSPRTNDFSDLAEILYWAYRFGNCDNVKQWLSDEDFAQSVRDLPLFTLSELSLAVYLLDPERHGLWQQHYGVELQARLANEYGIIALADNDDTLTVHFISRTADDNSPTSTDVQDSEPLHSETKERLQLVRQLYPTFDKYGSQGYGHKFGTGLFSLPVDNTAKKGVIKKYLTPYWPIRINRVAISFAGNRYRQQTWADYITQALEARNCLIQCLGQLKRGIIKYFERSNPVNILRGYIDVDHWERCKSLINLQGELPLSAVDPWGFASEHQSEERSNDPVLLRYQPEPIAVKKYRSYLETQRSYFSDFAAFLLQCPQVLLTNFIVGKLRDNDHRKKTLLERLKNSKVDTDLAHLSTYNLYQAENHLRNYQIEFRKLFASNVNEGQLVTIEESEIQLYESVWELWYFYANRPNISFFKPIRQIHQRIESARKQLEEKIQTSLLQGTDDGNTSTRINVDFRWDDLPTFWILLKVQDAINLNQSIEELIHKLHSAFSQISTHSLEYYLVEDFYQYVVIVPVVRGRLINKSVWPLRTTITLLDPILDLSKFWLFTPKELPDNMIQKLGLQIWESEGINQANLLSSSVAGLTLLMAQLTELQNLPDPNKAGEKILEEFIQRRSQQLSDLLQGYYVIASVLLTKFNQLSEEEKSLREQLSKAIKILTSIHESIKPPQEQMRLDEIIQYSEQLEQVFKEADAIRLLWISDEIRDLSEG